MGRLSPEEKINLLTTPIWKKKDAVEYFGFSTNKMFSIFKNLKEPENFKKCVYRDDLFKEVGTSVDKELEILRVFTKK